MKKRDSFTNRLGFILACVGSAVGMGNLWMFPTRVSLYGGGSFLIPYFIFVVLIGATGVIGEMAFGRAARSGPVNAFGMALESRGKRKLGEALGLIPMVGALAMAIGYTVVMGWILKYAVGTFTGATLAPADVDSYAAAFGGNRADYREKIKAIDGVGGVKCYRATNAAGEKVGGYVRCVVIASDYSEPSTVLIDNIQTIIDPEQNHAEGDGLAPIGHIVTIAGAAGVKINVVTTITFDTGYTFADIKSRIETAVETYLLSLRRDWENSVAGLVVRIKQIEAALLDVEGILDVADTKLNGKAENIQLGVDEIPLRGEISG